MKPRLVRSEPDCAQDLTRFWRSVAEAVCWCLPRATLSQSGTCLRSPDLQPDLLAGDRFVTAAGVLNQRRFGVRSTDVDILLGSGAVTSGGRLLVYFPDGSLSDGAAEVASRGVFDMHNVPAWDTWVGMFADDPHRTGRGTDYLVAWIPPVLVELVAEGIEVNPEECIRWLEDTDTVLSRLVRDGG